MSHITELHASIARTVARGNEHMNTMRGAINEDEYLDAAAALADQWESLIRYATALVRATK
jgi:hypothetical protein